MLVTMLKSKVHRARVTEANLHYVGSLTVDPILIEAAGMYVNEKVTVVDINNGARLDTYVIEGERGSGMIGVNGAAARLIHIDDLVIIIAYALIDESELDCFVPSVVHVDSANRIVGIGTNPAETGGLPGLGRA